jgi:hypothetical protein
MRGLSSCNEKIDFRALYSCENDKKMMSSTREGLPDSFVFGSLDSGYWLQVAYIIEFSLSLTLGRELSDHPVF